MKNENVSYPQKKVKAHGTLGLLAAIGLVAKVRQI